MRTKSPNNATTHVGKFGILIKAIITAKTMSVMLPHAMTRLPGLRLKIVQNEKP
jgi:hypothetical protein